MKVVIITPSYRSDNLKKHLLPSIDFNYIEKWIIVHDSDKVKEKAFGENGGRILEFFNNDLAGDSGNPQRNRGLEAVAELYPEGSVFVYFLDDDNIIHPNFYVVLQHIEAGRVYTFDQVGHPCNKEIFYGDCPEPCNIDTAMFLVDFDVCRDIRWTIGGGAFADGRYIYDCVIKNRPKWVYMKMIACYYNKINPEKYG
tara:strand:- start:684 stop:1277 length:594 start_codon:yes stop_codon:yes gene_type:complete